MWPATLPITLRLIEATRLSSSELPVTTSKPPKKMIPPTMMVLRRLANRFRKAICATTPSPLCSVRRGGRYARSDPIDELSVGQPHNGVGVGHHVLIVRREDEGRL